MDLRDYLQTIATTYDRHAPLDSAAQRMLRRAKDHLREHVPGGLDVRGSGGTTTPTLTPWVGVFDPDETVTPQDGIYLVYLFAEDLRTVTLSLQQGITRLTRELGQRQARDRLADDARAIRDHLPPDALRGLSHAMRLASTGFRQLAYESGNIVAREYETSSLPLESVLREDLLRFIDLYQAAVISKRHLLQSSPGTIASSSVLKMTEARDPLHDFKPKSDADYIAHIQGRRLQKSRRHETLVRQYGEEMQATGLQPSTPHPLDLVLRNDLAQLLDLVFHPEGPGAEGARSADPVLHALVQTMRRMVRRGEHRDPRRPGPVEDHGRVFARILELFRRRQRVDRAGQIAVTLGLGEHDDRCFGHASTSSCRRYV